MVRSPPARQRNQLTRSGTSVARTRLVGSAGKNRFNPRGDAPRVAETPIVTPPEHARHSPASAQLIARSLLRVHAHTSNRRTIRDRAITCDVEVSVGCRSRSAYSPPDDGPQPTPVSARPGSATHSILRVARNEARQLADRGFRAGSRSVRALSEHVAMGASDPAFGAVGNASGPRFRAAIARQGAWSPSEVLGPSPQPPIGRHPPARRAVYPRAADR